MKQQYSDDECVSTVLSIHWWWRWDDMRSLVYGCENIMKPVTACVCRATSCCLWWFWWNWFPLVYIDSCFAADEQYPVWEIESVLSLLVIQFIAELENWCFDIIFRSFQFGVGLEILQEWILIIINCTVSFYLRYCMEYMVIILF